MFMQGYRPDSTSAPIIVFRNFFLTPCTQPTEGALYGPGQQNNLAAKPTPVDAGMDLACRCERQSLNHDWVNGANEQQLEQRCHVGLEFLRVLRSAGRYAVEDGAA